MYLFGLYVYVFYEMIHGPYNVKFLIFVCLEHKILTYLDEILSPWTGSENYLDTVACLFIHSRPHFVKLI